jgi:hypothetical protein
MLGSQRGHGVLWQVCLAQIHRRRSADCAGCDAGANEHSAMHRLPRLTLHQHMARHFSARSPGALANPAQREALTLVMRVIREGLCGQPCRA